MFFFSGDRPKTAAVCDGSRKFLGSEFQNIGPATENAISAKAAAVSAPCESQYIIKMPVA